MEDLMIRKLDRDMAVRQLAALHTLATDQLWMRWEDKSYLKELPDKWELSQIAFHGENPVGYALCSRKGDILWLHRLVVDVQQRSRGIGEALLAELARVAKVRGLSGIGAKRPDGNIRAARFYQRHGFQEIGKENGYVSLSRRSLQDSLTVGIHQPNFLPWLGYFYKMFHSDVFVLLDDVQVPKGGYFNRTAVLVQDRPLWLTVPVLRGEARIDRVRQANTRWTEKHLKTLEQNYRNAPFVKDYIGAISETIGRHAGGAVADLNTDLIKLISEWLGIGSRIVKSSDFGVEKTSDDRLIRLVQAVGGTHYLSGKGGENYQDPEKFFAAGVGLLYSGFQSTPHVQTGGQEFVPGLSVVDALFNIGADGIRSIFESSPQPAEF